MAVYLDSALYFCDDFNETAWFASVWTQGGV